jgi:hypothetical protein
MTMNDPAPGRRDIEDMLPWLAAGTLKRRDAERVEAAMRDDPELARRFELVREELAETIHLNETLGAPSARASERLFAAIDREPQRRASFNFSGRVLELLSRLSPRTLAWSAGAAAVVIVLQAAVISGSLIGGQGEQRSYGTASAGAPAETAAASEVLIRFAPQASAAGITQFLQAHKATIVGGPSGDFYRVRVADTVLPKPQLDAIVNAMQDEHGVVSAVFPKN